MAAPGQFQRTAAKVACSSLLRRALPHRCLAGVTARALQEVHSHVRLTPATPAAAQPMFCDITWGAGGSTADLTLDIASKMQNSVCTVLSSL